VYFSPIDADKLRDIYRRLKNKVVKEIEFDRNIVLPKINGIHESFIGIIPCTEFLKLICDDDGNLQKNLFYDNVRDFQGNNPVNEEIAQTLKGDLGFRDKFVVLNNGITIVAKSLGKVSTTFKLIDYQIVNGCQTSHILYYNKNLLNPNVYLPVKIIITSDNQVTNAIIKATNRQTVVNIEAFESLRDFHKELEAFYASFEEKHRLYYERRSKQYDNDPKIKKNRVISLSTQIQSFISMFLLEPHSIHRYYGELLKVYREDKKQLFIDTHELYPYYISGYALNILERFINSSKIDSKYRRLKHQMIMMFRVKAMGVDLPKLTDKKGINNYCKKLQSILWNQDKALEYFMEIGSTIDTALARTKLTPYDAARRRHFTTELIAAISGKGLPSASRSVPKRDRGTVKWFDPDRGYGFIQTEHGQDVFVHYSAIWGTGYKALVKDQRVELTVVDSTKGLQAKDVEVTDSSAC
jgi:cold shock CspA family protein